MWLLRRPWERFSFQSKAFISKLKSKGRQWLYLLPIREDSRYLNISLSVDLLLNLCFKNSPHQHQMLITGSWQTLLTFTPQCWASSISVCITPSISSTLPGYQESLVSFFFPPFLPSQSNLNFIVKLMKMLQMTQQMKSIVNWLLHWITV